MKKSREPQFIDPLAVVKVETVGENYAALCADTQATTTTGVSWQTQQDNTVQGVPGHETVLVKEEVSIDDYAVEDSKDMTKDDGEESFGEEEPTDILRPEIVFVKVESEEAECEDVDLHLKTEETTLEEQDMLGSGDLTGEMIDGRCTLLNNKNVKIGKLSETTQAAAPACKLALQNRDSVDPPAVLPEDNLFQCDLCNKSFSTKKSLNRHQSVHSEDKPFQCDICKTFFRGKDGLVKHQSMHSGIKPFKCDTCDKSFPRKTSLRQHQATVHLGVKEFKCTICNKSFGCKGTLVRHLVVHSGCKQFKCDTCNKSFSQKYRLEQHQAKVHLGVFEFKCDICSKPFGCKTTLVQHQVVHSGSKPFKCDICNKSVAFKGSLFRHKASVHSKIKPYKCSTCEKLFSRRVDLVQHHSAVHLGQRLFKCDTCNKCFSRKNNLVHHQLNCTQT